MRGSRSRARSSSRRTTRPMRLRSPMAPSFSAFAELMNAEGGGARPARLALRASRRARRARRVLERRRRHQARRAIVMRTRFVRETVDRRPPTIAGGRTLHTWDDLLGVFPAVFGVKTGHTDDAGWCQVAAARGEGATIYATLLGCPSRTQRNADLQALLIWGLGQYRVVDAVRTGHVYASVRSRTERRRSTSSPPGRFVRWRGSDTRSSSASSRRQGRSCRSAPGTGSGRWRSSTAGGSSARAGWSRRARLTNRASPGV